MSLSTVFQAKQPRLHVRSGVDRGKSIWLDDEELSLGSDPSCSLKMDDPDIMPRHLALFPPVETELTAIRKALRFFKTEKRIWSFSLADDPYATVNEVAGVRNGQVDPPLVFRLSLATIVEITDDTVDDDAPPGVIKRALGGSARRVPMRAMGAYTLMVFTLLFVAVAIVIAMVDISEWGWTSNETDASADAVPSLAITSMFCALNTQTAEQQEPMWDQIGICLGHTDAQGITPAIRQDITNAINDIAFSISTKNIEIASQKLRSLSLRLSVGQCQIANALASDVLSVASVQSLDEC